MVTHALNVLSHKLGTELIALADAIAVRYGLTEIVCAQTILNGMDTTALHAQMEKCGSQLAGFAPVRLIWSGTDIIVFSVKEVEFLILTVKLVFAQQVSPGQATHVQPSAHLTSFGMPPSVNANAQQASSGMEQIAFNAQTEGTITLSQESANAKTVSGMDTSAELTA